MDSHFESVDLKKILDIIVAFNNERDFMNLLDIILNKMRDIALCEAGTLYVVRDGKLHFAIMHNEILGNFLREEEITLPPVSLDKTAIENVSAYCAIKNTVINIADVYNCNEFNFQGPKNYDKLTGFHTKSMMVFPLPDLQGNVIGVIQLINARDQSNNIIRFDPNLEFVFRSIANIAASALANMQNVEEIKGLFYSFVRVMSQAIDERSPYTVNHAKKTAEYVKDFVRYLRDRFPPDSKYHLDENKEEQLIMATLLHDIGKVVTPLDIMDKESRLDGKISLIRQRFAIKKLQVEVEFLSGRKPESEYNAEIKKLSELLEVTERINTASYLSDDDAVLVCELSALTYTDETGTEKNIFEPYDIESLSIRRGTLTDSERDSMQNHVVVTGRLLDNIVFNKQYEHVPDWARKHHEFMDGTGYPDKLTQTQIPIEAHLITIMDIFDSLTASDRPYRKSISFEKALGILIEMADEGKLDGELVELFAESGAGKTMTDDAVI
ncbi:MAG: HD domain-containing protein [Oscillospiraceae bacterium]|nr:HD domain-containing protein [Oscillospiraceae bacterium]